ncbi:MAG: TonB-dependent hemoglobin/transferrin/lactoferrin family receptor [Bradyrhizobiaceae bacterium]|nr:TonB-dependent hemoglobin/transferrin/lactoferrin family receptor [Bradyrhizobiaceae bacterium]
MKITRERVPASKRRTARLPASYGKKHQKTGAAVTFHGDSRFVLRARALALAASALALGTAGAPATASAQEPYWLDALTVLATKTEERAIDSLAAVSTVREEQIRQLAASRTHQIFFGVPGVSSEATAQDPGTAINIRGLQDFGRVAVIIDGARQNFARAGHDGSGSFYLEPELLAEADVIRGPVANIYGSGAIGGVVSFRTKDVDDILKPGERWGVATAGEIGSNKFSGLGSIFAAVRPNEKAEYIVGGTYRHLDDYKDGGGNLIPNSGETVGTGLAKATFRPAEGHMVKFGGIYYDADWTNGSPGSNVIRDSNSKNLTATANWRYSKPEDRLFDFDATAYWNRVDVSTIATYVEPGYEGFYGPVGNRAGYLLNTGGFDVHNTSRFETGPLRHALTYGGDFFRDTVENTDPGGFGDGYNPSGERSVGGAFVQLKTNYSTWLEIITALRYDTYKLDGVDVTSGDPIRNDGSRVSPKVTVGLSPLPWFTLYGTYAEGYRAPSVTETLISSVHPAPAFTFLPNPNLKPEIGKSKEVGINIKRDDLFRPGDRLRVKANVFRNDVEDFIDDAFVPYTGPFGECPAPPFCARYENISQARIEGVEFESHYDRGDWFFGLSAHRLRGKDLTEGDPLGKVPADMVATTFGVRSADRKWTAAVRWAAVAAKKLNDLPSGTSPEVASGSYNLVNLYLGYQPNENVIAALSVENLLDEEYKVYTHEYNSPGITVKGSLRVRFAGGVPPAKEEKKFVK